MSEVLEQLGGLPLELEQDEKLVQRARGGESAAFDELVRRHRLKAFSWATHLARDQHLAEDIVQDALIRAFLHLGTLVNDARFLGWLKRIVQNQALMKLRRGGPYSREMPISTFQTLVKQSQTVDPHDLDSIMSYLISRGYKQVAVKIEADPQMSLDRQEWYITLRGMLRCLTSREKKIFEAYFFQECSPADIAELFGISMGNVYKLISRSRQKVQQERLSFLIRAHIRQRKDDGCMKQMVLDKQLLIEPGGAVLTGTEMLYRAVRVRYPEYSLAYVGGLLTAAFMINIEKMHVDMSSTNMTDRNYSILNGMLNMGLVVRYAETFDFEPPDPKLMLDAINLAQLSVDRGMPAVVWELLHSEFGLIYGYNDEKQHFFGMDSQGDDHVPYDRLGRLQTRSLFVLGFIDEIALSDSDVLWRVCRMICRHANGEEATFTGYVNGLKAYDTWMEVLQQKAIEPLGHAFTISVVLQERQHAVEFLKEIATQWGNLQELEKEEKSIPFKQEIHQLLMGAFEHYSRVVESFLALSQLFPTPSGGEPNEIEESEKAIILLNNAKEAEKAGVGILTIIADKLEKHAPRNHIPPIVENPPRAYEM